MKVFVIRISYRAVKQNFMCIVQNGVVVFTEVNFKFEKCQFLALRGRGAGISGTPTAKHKRRSGLADNGPRVREKEHMWTLALWDGSGKLKSGNSYSRSFRFMGLQ